MKRIILGLLLALAISPAWAQCNGIFPAHTICGNISGVPAPPGPISSSGTVVGPGTTTIGHFATWADTSGQQLADYDLFALAHAWALTQTFTLAPVFTDQSGSRTALGLGTAATQNTGTSGANLPFLNGNNTWSGTNRFNSTLNAAGGLQISGTSAGVIPWTVSVGGTGNATAATHTIPINQGTSAQANTGTGSLGQCVQSSGASADPAFTAGCWQLLNTLTAASSASLSDNTSFTSTFNTYQVVLTNIVPNNNGVSCQFKINSGGVQSTNYDANILFIGSSSAPTTFIPCSRITAMSNTGGASITYTIPNPSQTTIAKGIYGIGAYRDSTAGSYGSAIIGGAWTGGTTAITGFELSMSAGAIVSGTVRVYGRN